MVRLVCAIVGSEGTDSIDIASSDVVSNLRILIKDRYANTLEKIDAPHLKLFLATKNGAWLPCDDPMALKLERGQVDADIKQAVSGDPLNAAWTIDNVLVANNMTSRAPKSTQIHILVKVPESFSLTKRVRLGEVEDVPQINIHGVDFVTLPAVLLEKCGLERSDLMLRCDVNNEDVQEQNADEKKNYTLDLKFSYAGGSCRFMFQFSTSEVIAALASAINSVQNKTELIKYSSGAVHSETINKLYGMERHQELGGERFPTIADLERHLNTSKNPSLDGHILEWMFLASVPRYAVQLAGNQGEKDVLPQANVLSFDPKKRFKRLPDGSIKGDGCWLQPVAWNQGGYDAVYFVKAEGKVTFTQVTRSNKHDFKMRYFSEVLLKLRAAGMVDNVEDRGVLEEHDSSWTRPDEDHVKTRAFFAPSVYRYLIASFLPIVWLWPKTRLGFCHS
ncbi:hypothetical protein ON010_g654 [Phytophthora cinnamomi]|nr:hypothetical protein ON010_g654 [Phytophthora cinnamomi]